MFALLMLAGGIFYLDSFRERMLEQRTEQRATAAELLATALGKIAHGEPARAALAARFGEITEARLRIYAADGTLLADSWRATGPTFVLRDPEAEPLQEGRRADARPHDRGRGRRRAAAALRRARTDTRSAWPEAETARAAERR